MSELYVISGVTGMTGNELARKLVESGNKVIGFDNFFASSLDTVRDLLNLSDFVFHEYDLNVPKDMEKLKKEVSSQEKIDKLVYINCAAVVHTEHFYYINRTFNTNVIGMKAFLDQALEVKADIFINCSTSEVYSMNSWNENGGVSEADYITMANAEHSQRTSYATGKLLTEFFMKDAVDAGKIKGCSIRFANVYSKNELYPKHIIPHIINELRQGGSVELLENSRKNKRTFLHNEDSCAAVIELINTYSALDGTVYNVATDEEISIVDLVYLCAGKLGIENPQIIFKGYRESDPERRLLNTDKIRKRTKWQPKITLDRGIEMCLEEKM